MKQSLRTALVSAITTLGMIALFFLVNSAFAAPTQPAPNGNPTFPLQGSGGPAGPAGPIGPAGPTGPTGTFTAGSCEVCVSICDWNGAGPCSQTCDLEGGGWSPGVLLPGTVDANDLMRVRFECT